MSPIIIPPPPLHKAPRTQPIQWARPSFLPLKLPSNFGKGSMQKLKIARTRMIKTWPRCILLFTTSAFPLSRATLKLPTNLHQSAIIRMSSHYSSLSKAYVVATIQRHKGSWQRWHPRNTCSPTTRKLAWTTTHTIVNSWHMSRQFRPMAALVQWE